MTILQECPLCKKKQSLRNKICKCGRNLDAAKKARQVKYWINYRLPDGKQRRESVSAIEDLDGYSIEDARTAMSKRTVQKKENRILEMLPENKVTFQELTEWYIDLKTVKNLASYNRVKIALNNFNKVFGHKKVNNIKLVDIENYQEDRSAQGRSPATVDMEVSIVKTMIIKAFYNDMIDGHVLKAFGNVKRKLKKGSNARKRTLTIEYYRRIHKASKARPCSFKGFLNNSV